MSFRFEIQDLVSRIFHSQFFGRDLAFTLNNFEIKGIDSQALNLYHSPRIST